MKHVSLLLYQRQASQQDPLGTCKVLCHSAAWRACEQQQQQRQRRRRQPQQEQQPQQERPCKLLQSSQIKNALAIALSCGSDHCAKPITSSCGMEEGQAKPSQARSVEQVSVRGMMLRGLRLQAMYFWRPTRAVGRSFPVHLITRSTTL